VLCEESAPHRGDGYEAPDTRLVLMVDETPGISFLPYRESWARRAPSFDDFGVGARIGTNPLEKVKDQSLNGIGHRFLLVGVVCGLDQMGQVVPIAHPFALLTASVLGRDLFLFFVFQVKTHTLYDNPDHEYTNGCPHGKI